MSTTSHEPWVTLYSGHGAECLAYQLEPEWAEALSTIISPDFAVLEVGAGSGRVTSLLAKLAKSIVATDIIDREHTQFQLDVPYIQADAVTLPFGNEVFDLVVASDVVSLLDDPVAALTEWSRVLTASGQIIMNVQSIFDDTLSLPADGVSNRAIRDRPGPFWVDFHSRCSLNALLESATLKVEKIEGYFRNDPPHQHYPRPHRHHYWLVRAGREVA